MDNLEIKDLISKKNELERELEKTKKKINEISLVLNDELSAKVSDDSNEYRCEFFTIKKVVKHDTKIDINSLVRDENNAKEFIKFVSNGGKISISAKERFKSYLKDKIILDPYVKIEEKVEFKVTLIPTIQNSEEECPSF